MDNLTIGRSVLEKNVKAKYSKRAMIKKAISTAFDFVIEFLCFVKDATVTAVLFTIDFLQVHDLLRFILVKAINVAAFIGCFYLFMSLGIKEHPYSGVSGRLMASFLQAAVVIAIPNLIIWCIKDGKERYGRWI